MKHFKLLLASFALFGAMNANAQTDVTSTYIVNPGFEDCSAASGNQAAGKTTTGIDYTDSGWTFLYDQGAETWAMSAVLSYGSDGQINGAAIPATDNEGNTGNALGVSVGWGHSFYYQSASPVTLPVGHYELKVYAYNNNNATQLKSLFGFVATNGSSYLSTKTSFTTGQWVTDVVTFDLTEETEGKFQIGGQAISGGSGANAKVFFDNISLVYTDPEQAVKDAYADALQQAKDAIANEDYNIVTGEERNSLDEAISTYEGITSNYEAATTALKDATSAFTAAKAAYDAFEAAKTSTIIPDLAYASAEKKSAIESAVAAEAPTSAADATEKAAAITNALRAYYESHALAEGVEGAVVMTDRIANANNPANNNDWTWTGNKNNPASNEPWTDADGTNTHSYFDGGNWGANSWTTTMQQTISIPAGKYLLTAKGRSAIYTTLTMAVGENSVELPHVGSVGNVFNRGWGDASVEFETAGEDVTILVTASSNTIHEWFSISNFRLVQLEAIEVPMADADDYAALAAAIEGKVLGFDEGEYAPYNNVEAIKALAAAKKINPEAEEGNTKEAVQNATEALNNAEWVANTEEVNAIFDGSFLTDYSAQSGNVQPIGWYREKGTEGDGYNVRYMGGTNAGLTATSTSKALFTKTAAFYGWADGYTMPLNANTAYEISFVYGGWSDCKKDGFVTITDAEGNNIELTTNRLPLDAVDGDSNPDSWKTYKAYFTTGEAGDYVLGLRKDNERVQSQYVYGDFMLVKAVVEDIVLEDAATEAPAEAFGNVTYDRNLVAGYNTLVLPFNVKKEELSENVEAIYAYGGSELTGEGENAIVHLDFTQTVEEMKANTPYIVKMAALQEGLSFTNKAVAPVAEPIITDANFDFVGTYVALPAGNETIVEGDYVSAASGLKPATAGKKLNAFRAFLKKKAEVPAGAKVAIMIGDEVVDGIQAAQIINNVDGTIYNLNGQKVINAQKGIFIQNGKKVVIK